MANKIVWTKRADKKFLNILKYLNEEWGQKVTKAFIRRTYNFLDLLIDFPEMDAVQNPSRNIRGFLLTKHTTVFYRIEGRNIILLNFFDNRKKN
ncbi:type II toxin-antitoxin system RelE/ParE family toxin [Adhaeribacter rhizoryzae]|uniref:Type II toxin-antitoxin system RelE/ParE family toxin n=1 Tax=Adhaeribacter rhizoryzae TaxID=2607907 RepID=A0A5M6DDT2_9BACT|nr:type II toxin-antitoxin system RelE/ParE family toxin [Adhaeribacter rhizoryzae]KAA5545727.1 type II toxin-antitoxin system RelE/ParE family toxin [Adhaeribacter rhizoryzae]